MKNAVKLDVNSIDGWKSAVDVDQQEKCSGRHQQYFIVFDKQYMFWKMNSNLNMQKYLKN